MCSKLQYILKKKEREHVNGYGTASFSMQKLPDDQFLEQIGLTVYKEEEE